MLPRRDKPRCIPCRNGFGIFESQDQCILESSVVWDVGDPLPRAIFTARSFTALCPSRQLQRHGLFEPSELLAVSCTAQGISSSLSLVRPGTYCPRCVPDTEGAIGTPNRARSDLCQALTVSTPKAPKVPKRAPKSVKRFRGLAFE